MDVRVDLEREMRALQAQKLGDDAWRLNDGTLVDLLRFETVTRGGIPVYIGSRSFVTISARLNEPEGPLAKLVQGIGIGSK